MERTIERVDTGERLTLKHYDGFTTYSTESAYEGRMFKDYGDGRLYEFGSNGGVEGPEWTWVDDEQTTATTNDGHVSVNIIPNGADNFMAFALLNDGANYGGASYWFTIGHYASVKNAQRASIRQLAKHGYTIVF